MAEVRMMPVGRKGMKRTVVLSTIFRYGVFVMLLLGALVMLFPIAWMVSMSLKEQNEIYTQFPKLIPDKITLQNFSEGWVKGGFYDYYVNSTIVTTIRVLLTVAINAMAGYAFGKYRFRGKGFLFLLVLSAMMIPDQVRMIPLYSMINSLGFMDTFASVIFPGLGATFGTFLMTQYVKTVPDELMEAARIDGCSEYRIFSQIIMPLVKPALVTNLIFQFMWGWNDLLYPLLFLQSQEKYTLQLALAFFRDSDTVTAGPIMAMSLASIIPILIIFFLLQRYFVEGIAVHGVKG
ncbi:carbohydrate ABC transporter permease [Paenibacillus abyssi]|uniref:Sugar ABC transporter permease n=1 Tax=Paenibacillus abyssi TaxID=1340531 RepID=A0A917CZ04_9BACL|nr:carbohydrate ABC transporter permease [Paenibacillus abyssi]GGG03449.1 sugar ABC transporter permease [Paenibacillus abyssi]